MQYVIVVNVGPVQGFIATARRTRDLWFGSWLLSELSRAALATLRDECGATVISPSTSGSPEEMLVNHITAVIDEQGLKALPTLLPKRLIECIEAEWSKVGSRFALDPNVDALAQLRDLPECTWAAAPIVKGYAAARDAAGRLLAARKSTRTFAPVRWGFTKAKSSLDGALESVIPEGAYPDEGDRKEQGRTKVDELYRTYGAGPAERLSAVDLLKRKGGGERHVASTTHMAALPLLERMQSEAPQCAPHVRTLLASLRKQGVKPQKLDGANPRLAVLEECDASLLYLSRLGDEAEERQLTEEEQAGAAEALQQFFSALGYGSPPPAYYAVLMADGDFMGIVVDAQQTEEEHAALSAALLAFATAAQKVVAAERNRGLLVYSGGDDVLALLPVHRAIACAAELADLFRRSLSHFKGQTAEGQEVSPTLSAGIVIAHHLEPLSDVLRLGRAAEATAKGVPGKNALAVTLSKRSGADRTISGGWTAGFAERINDYVDLHLQDAVPDGVAYELQDLSLLLTDVRGAKQTDAHLMEFVQGEALRILGRKRAAQGSRKVDEQIRQRLEQDVHAAGVPEQVALELMVAGEIARACRVAGLSRAIRYEHTEALSARSAEDIPHA